jgi:hypothetical protein
MDYQDIEKANSYLDMKADIMEIEKNKPVKK